MDEGGPWGGSDHSSRCGVVEVVRQLESAPMEKVELVELDRQDVKWERQKGVGMGVGLESRFEDGKCTSTLGRTSSRALVP